LKTVYIGLGFGEGVEVEFGDGPGVLWVVGDELWRSAVSMYTVV
jgi:hypothetical protein